MQTMLTDPALAPVLPEMLLVAGAMALLMIGVFRGERSGALIGWLAILLLTAVAVLVSGQGEQPLRLFNGAFVSDGFGRFMKILVLTGAAGALLLAFDYFRTHKGMPFEYPVLALLATAGMMMMISAGDLIALYLGLEMQSLPLYVAAAIRRDDVRSSEAGLKYFVLGALSSGMLLYGCSLIYGFTGTTQFDVLAHTAAAAMAPGGTGLNVGLVFGLVFLLAGIAFKLSAVPFHMWAPDVYEGAPTPVTAFLAAAPKIAAMALLMRVVLGAFPQAVPAMSSQWQQIVVFLSIASMLFGAVAAIGQTNIKRLMAYSSIGHIGFALVGLAPGTEEGTQGVLVYLAIYLAMTLGSFAAILSMRRNGEYVEKIADLAGLARTNLPMAALLTVLMFSLAGIPPLGGFWAKFFVFMPAIKAGYYVLAVLGVIASVVGAYYYLHIIKVMFIDDPAPGFERAAWPVRAVLGLSALAMLVLGVYPTPLLDAAEAAARTLF